MTLTTLLISNRRLAQVASAALLALAAGCTTASHMSASEGNDFPAATSAKWQQGTFASVEALRSMRTGMGKDQVRDLLGSPHFSEGIAGVHEWNYLFHFRTGPGPEFVTCQYKVSYDNAMVVSGTAWKPAACADYLDAKSTPMSPPMPVASAPAPARKMSLSADGLFRFDGGRAADLMPEGRRKVEQLASEIQRDMKSGGSVMVTGHTDRLGSAAYNERLSQQRADTVRDLLVAGGVPRQSIRTSGMGERQPVTQCEGRGASPSLIACLQPNRRVDIEVSGER